MTNSASNFIPILGQNGNFFDMVDKSGVCLITDYSSLYKNIIVSEENMVTLGKDKEKTKIPSIGSIKEILRALIQHNIKICCKLKNLFIFIKKFSYTFLNM